MGTRPIMIWLLSVSLASATPMYSSVSVFYPCRTTCFLTVPCFFRPLYWSTCFSLFFECSTFSTDKNTTHSTSCSLGTASSSDLPWPFWADQGMPIPLPPLHLSVYVVPNTILGYYFSLYMRHFPNLSLLPDFKSLENSDYALFIHVSLAHSTIPGS